MKLEICVTYTDSSQTEPYIFSSDIVTIGRNPTNDLVLSEGTVSGLHGRVILRNNRFFFQDLNSTNGTLLQRSKDSWRIAPSSAEGEEINPGDVLLLGDATSPVKLLISCAEPAKKKESQQKPQATIIARCSISHENTITNDARCLNSLYRILKETSLEDEQGRALGNIADCIASSIKGITRVQFAVREDENEDEWKIMLRRSFGEGPEEDLRTVPKAIADAVWNKKEAVLFADMDEKPISKSVAASKSSVFACAPLITKEAGDGILLVESTDSSAISPVDLELIAAIASHVSVVLDRITIVNELKKARQKLKQENVFLKEQQKKRKEYEIIGESKLVAKLKEQINHLAPNDATVLVTGETGTGKELVARSLHYMNEERKDALFIAINCGAIPENLLESELFGHTKGSFTGAVANRQGMFALADGGTLFLDEIAEIPLNLQVKLLRALQENEFWPIGAQKPVQSNVRLISATNRNLQKEMTEKRFREDLYYRVKVVELKTPTLRDRPEDIPLLLKYFLDRLGKGRKGIPTEITPAAVAMFASYQFPGNVRELMNEVERAAVFASPGTTIDVEHLSPHVSMQEDTDESPHAASGYYLKEAMLKYEKSVLETALRDQNANRTATALFLGISRQALLMKMKKLDIK